MLVPKGVRRLDGLDAMIVSLFAGGMTIRDIGHHLASTIGTELSHETISKITDAVCDEVLAWQQRPLEALYPVIYLDAIIVKVRDGGHMRNKAAHIAIGVDLDGIKHQVNAPDEYSAPIRSATAHSSRVVSAERVRLLEGTEVSANGCVLKRWLQRRWRTLVMVSSSRGSVEVWC
jgi:hypothetical protein